MADVQIKDNRKGKVRSRKMSTRIDFTPMVDLGFLLITFFMLTTALSKPQIMAMVMPDKKATSEAGESKVLTLLLGENDKIYWYEGITDAKLDSTDYDNTGLRKVILDKMSKLEATSGLEFYKDTRTNTERTGSKLQVIIKATATSRYRNLVDVLDEMAICKVRYYVIMDISKVEEDFIINPAGGLNFSTQAQIDAARK